MATGTLPGWIRPMNAVVKALQRLGLAMGPVHVLTVRGRVSGEPRATPVSPLEVEGRRYVVAALPQADWARNVRAAGSGDLARGRTRTRVRLHEVTDPALRRTVMAAFPREVPGGVQFFVRLGLVQDPTPEEFAAASDRVAVFEIA